MDGLPEFAARQNRKNGQDHKHYQYENTKWVALGPDKAREKIKKISNFEIRSTNLERSVFTNDYVCFQEQNPCIADNPNG